MILWFKEVTSQEPCTRLVFTMGPCKGTAELRRQDICVQLNGMNRTRSLEPTIDIISEIKHGVHAANCKVKLLPSGLVACALQ